MERIEGDKSKAPPLSRLAQLRVDRGDDYEPEMPPLAGGEYLLAYLWETGPTLAAGMGAGPITHTELAAWCALTGTTLNGWETRTLRRLSIEYLNQAHKAEKRDCPAPWKAADVPRVVSAAQAAIRALAEL